MVNGEFVTLPELGLGDRPIVLSTWLVKEGARVREGEPAVEVLAGAVTVDLPAPADGIIAERFVAEGDAIVVGQRLARLKID
jgi:pyruvate/2-oxoglutarate dehydrogenase complex dihydrolipoamide acyltransferase (E2) component